MSKKKAILGLLIFGVMSIILGTILGQFLADTDVEPEPVDATSVKYWQDRLQLCRGIDDLNSLVDFNRQVLLDYDVVLAMPELPPFGSEFHTFVKATYRCGAFTTWDLSDVDFIMCEEDSIYCYSYVVKGMVDYYDSLVGTHLE